MECSVVPGKTKQLHNFSHSALSPTPRRRTQVMGLQTVLGVKRKSHPVCETHLTAGKQGVEEVVEEVESIDLASLSPRLCSVDFTSLFLQSAGKWRRETTLTISPTLKKDKRKQHGEAAAVPPNGYRWAVQGIIGHVSWQKKKKIRRNSADGAGKLRLSTRWLCRKQHWGVGQCVSSFCGGVTTLIVKHCIPFRSTPLRTTAGLEANSCALYREWGIELCCGVTRRPPGPPLSLAPLSLWRGSRWSSVAGWSRSRSPGDWRGCGWSSRGGLQVRRRWAPLPRDRGKRSTGRNHRRKRPGHRRRCSHATDIPTALQSDTHR